MKQTLLNRIKLCVILLITTLGSLQAQYKGVAAEKAGWRLATQAYTFRNFSLEESLDKLNEAGIKNIEMYSKQQIGAGITGTTSYNMDKKTMAQVQSLLKQKGIKLVNYGVITPSDSAEWTKLFEFAKEMGIETILSEPKIEHLPMIDRMANKYGINIAIHNHALPSYYWHPSIVMNAIKNRSKRIGVAPDFGHWVRSGLNPLECVKMLEGRIITIHVKDLNGPGVAPVHEVPWGTGTCNLPGIFHELKRQGFKGVFTIEYEYNWDNSLPEVKECAQFFYRTATWVLKD